MLTEQVRTRRRPTAHPSVSLSSEGPSETEPPAPSPVGGGDDARPRARLVTCEPPARRGRTDRGGGATAPLPQAEARVALNVAALMLVGTSGGLFMHGSTLGVRVLFGRRLDLRAGISFLRPEDGTYHRELLPLQLSATIDVPRLSGLRAGGGVEAVLVSGDEGARDSPSAWSLGAIGRLEYRHAIRSFALMSSVQAALHPRSWSTGDLAPALAIPPWTLAASLGLEFRIF